MAKHSLLAILFTCLIGMAAAPTTATDTAGKKTAAPVSLTEKEIP